MPLRTLADFRSHMQRYFAVSVLDLSPTGLRLASFGLPCEQRDRQLVRLPTLAGLPVELVWQRNGEAGLRFERPLHPAVFDLLAARYGVAGMAH